MNELDVLREEVQRLSREVEAQRERRAQHNRVLGVLGLGAALVSVVALAAPYDCNTGALGRGLYCFRPNEPAIANEVNGNFYSLSGAVDAGEARDGVHDTRLNGFQTRIAALETDVAALKVGERVISGAIAYPNPQCSATGSACTISFPAGSFTQAPRCVLTLKVPDTSGYQEHMVVLETYPDRFSLWEGQYFNAGSTMSVQWVCSGR